MSNVYDYHFEAFFCNKSTASLVLNQYRNVTIPFLTTSTSSDYGNSESVNGLPELSASTKPREEVLISDELVTVAMDDGEAKESNPVPQPTVDVVVNDDDTNNDGGNEGNTTLILVLCGMALLVLMTCGTVIFVVWRHYEKKKETDPGTEQLSPSTKGYIPGTDGYDHDHQKNQEITRKEAKSIYPDLPQEMDSPKIVKVTQEEADSDSEVWNDPGTADGAMGGMEVVTPGMHPMDGMNGMESMYGMDGVNGSIPGTPGHEEMDEVKASDGDHHGHHTFSRMETGGSDAMYNPHFVTKRGGEKSVDSSLIYEPHEPGLGQTDVGAVTLTMEQLPDEAEDEMHDDQSSSD